MWNSVKNKYPLPYANIHPYETHSFLWFIELGLLVSVWQESVFCQWLLLISKGQKVRGFVNGLINESQRRDGHVISFIEDADIRMRILCLHLFFLASHSESTWGWCVAISCRKHYCRYQHPSFFLCPYSDATSGERKRRRASGHCIMSSFYYKETSFTYHSSLCSLFICFVH